MLNPLLVTLALVIPLGMAGLAWWLRLRWERSVLEHYRKASLRGRTRRFR